MCYYRIISAHYCRRPEHFVGLFNLIGHPGPVLVSDEAVQVFLNNCPGI